jgi:hypothetical protein
MDLIGCLKTPRGAFRATGITAYLKNGGTLENAAATPNHASTRTTQLYDRRHDDINRIGRADHVVSRFVLWRDVLHLERLAALL